MLPSSQDVSLKPGFSRPPSEFLRDHGYSKNSRACEALELGRSKDGAVHSAKCRKRYEEWLADQFVQEDVRSYIAPLEAEENDDVPQQLSTGDRDEPLVVRDGDKDKPSVVHEGKKETEYVFTRGCPSCESGMNAPGIRRQRFIAWGRTSAILSKSINGVRCSYPIGARECRALPSLLASRSQQGPSQTRALYGGDGTSVSRGRVLGGPSGSFGSWFGRFESPHPSRSTTSLWVLERTWTSSQTLPRLWNR